MKEGGRDCMRERGEGVRAGRVGDERGEGSKRQRKRWRGGRDQGLEE